VQYRIGTKFHRHTNTLGKINICPKGLEYSAFVVDQPVDVTIIELNRAVLQRLSVGCEDLPTVKLTFRDGIFDPAIWRLVRAIEEEIAAGCPSGDVFGESLSVALLTYLLARYSVDAPQELPKWSLTDRQLRLVANYMLAHLEANISLAELANLTETGIYEFCRRFKNTTGLTPHNYLTELRVEEGKRLLAEQRASIAEVSLMLGFANQSHFTRVFRKMTGTTPKRFREDSARTVLQMSSLDAGRASSRPRLGRRAPPRTTS
jgi:AraC family transcriptional regulator